MYNDSAIIFNMTRLYSRLDQKTPTGVDRLDIRYAKYALNKSATHLVCFIRQRKEIVVVVPAPEATAVINFLWSNWVDNLVPSVPFKKPATKVYIENMVVFLRRKVNNILPNILINKFKNFSNDIVYLNVGHAGIQFYSVHKLLKDRLKCRLVFYLHDLIPIDYPEYCTDPKIKRVHELRLKVISEVGDLVLVNSLYTKSRLEAYCVDTGLRQPKIQINYIGVEESIINASSLPKQQLSESFRPLLGDANYFIFVSTIEPRKNHWMLLQVWLELNKVSKTPPKLVFLGKRGWRNQNVTDLLDYSQRLKNSVIEINLAEDEELISLVQNCKAMLFPSIDEGWGMPVAEALTLNVPVICSDISVLRECGQNQCTYLSPMDAKSWFDTISSNIDSKQTSYNPNTWNDHFSKLDYLLDFRSVNN